MGKMKPLYDGIKLNCTIVSDTHIDEKHPMPWLPKMNLRNALKDTKKSSAPVDAFLTIGDTTSRGSDANWKMTVECFDKVPDAAKNIILTVGNHDCWNDNGFDAAMKNYLRNFEIICGRKIDKPYFSYNINGYLFVFLGNDSDSGCEASIGEEQLKWFEGEMENGGKSGKPIFVFCHQSLNQKHGLPRTWDKDENAKNLWDGGLGKDSDAVEAILKKHKNVYYFSGHSHMGLGGENIRKAEGYSTFEKEGDLRLINLPSLSCGNHHGENKSTCLSVQLEVYDDKVVIRPRNTMKRKWITSVAIKDGKPCFEEKIEK